jgi:catechol 2,3-dioxygenase-like lactoylglutathione lyase family enzyme
VIAISEMSHLLHVLDPRQAGRAIVHWEIRESKLSTQRDSPRRGRIVLHHLDLNVSDLTASKAFYGPLLKRLGYASWEEDRGWCTYRKGPFYVCLVQAEAAHQPAGFHRKRIGLNHLAFAVDNLDELNAMADWLRAQGVPLLYSSPLDMSSKDEMNVAVYFEDPDRVKLELVYRPLPLFDCCSAHADIPAIRPSPGRSSSRS